MSFRNVEHNSQKMNMHKCSCLVFWDKPLRPAVNNSNHLRLLESIEQLANLMSQMHIPVFHLSPAQPTSAHIRSKSTLAIGREEVTKENY